MHKIKFFETTCLQRLEDTVNRFFFKLEQDNCQLVSINISDDNPRILSMLLSTPKYKATILYREKEETK